MERITRRRALFMLLVVVLILGFFGCKIYDIQIIETGGNMDNTSTFTTYTRVKAARGEILDKNGNVLVSNRASYDLVINHYVLISADGTNGYLQDLIELCDQKGITYTDRFPISQERPFTYTLDEYNAAWQGYFQTYLEYKGGLDSDITAPLLVEKLRDKYQIPPEWTDEQARRIMGLRYELDLRQCVGTLPNYVFMTDASDEDLSAIMELNIPGMNVEATTVREYNTTYASHILGYVGAMNAEQWEYYKDIEGYEMDAEVGQDGLEAAYEEYLHGVDGLREDTVATDGSLISSRYITEPKAGANVEVSIDINLQRTAEDALQTVIEDLRALEEGDGSDAGGGAVVAIDVKTGQVLVCGSYPNYDLSAFFENYNELAKDEYSPLYNRALLGAYPPGSTYKMSMVVAGMEGGAIDSKTKIADLGKFTKYDGFEANCLAYTLTGTTHGEIDATVALQKSCNYFFYELGDTIGIAQIDNTAKMLGLGEPTGIELYEEIGHRANGETKKKLYGKDVGWYMGDQVLAAIGQSDNRFTPMQLCVYTATLANQGKRYNATFMNRVVSSDYRSLHLENVPTLASQMNMSNETYETIKQGMYMVAHEYGGTAYKTFQDYPITIAAKTGTAQTGITGASDNAAFVCFAPLEDPQIAIAVYVEKGGHGSTLATVAKEIMDEYFSVGETADVNTYENQLS